MNEKLLYLMEQLYNMSEKQKNSFLFMLDGFTEEEKSELGLILIERIEKEKSLLNRLFGKIKLLFNKEIEEKDKIEADQLLLNL